MLIIINYVRFMAVLFWDIHTSKFQFINPLREIENIYTHRINACNCCLISILLSKVYLSTIAAELENDRYHNLIYI